MNKSAKSPTIAPPPPVSRLDERITRFFTECGRAIRKYWAPIIMVAAAAVLAAGLWGIFAWINDSREEDLAGRLYRLVESPDAQRAESGTLLAELDQLVRDSRGADSERFILKSVTEYLSMKAHPRNELASPGTVSPGMGPDPAELRKKIEEYAQLGKERFPQDPDVQYWSSQLLARIQGEREMSSKPAEKRAFTPVIPPVVPGVAPGTPSGSAPPPGSAAPSAFAPSASSTPPEGAPPAAKDKETAPVPTPTEPPQSPK